LLIPTNESLLLLPLPIPAQAVHDYIIWNYLEGLAVGVGFGAIGKSPSATFENAR
jgi:hypothetical protein